LNRHDFRPGRRAIALALAALFGALGGRSARAAVVPFMSLEDLTREATVVALGTVERTRAHWSDDHRVILTTVTLTVERALKGGPRASVAFEVPGGRVDGRTLVASGAPFFEAGQRVVLFLEPAGDGSLPAPRPLAVVGWNQGTMPVRRDPGSGRDLVQLRAGSALYLDRAGRPVAPEAAGAGPVELQEFLRRVASLVGGGGGR
jgi:hypothetical protein